MMPKRRFRVSLILAACMLLAGGSAYAIPCSSAGGCADCENGANNVAKCITVSYDAFCSCSIDVNNRTMCLLTDPCDYTGPGGGGGSGGGTGGGGTTCTRPAGGWCPAECSSCGTVYWN